MRFDANSSYLTKNDIAVLKGIAIIAMLFHHVYMCPPSFALPCSPFLYNLGVLGKVCVAMFVFCSGYGLGIQYNSYDTGRSTLHGFKSTWRFLMRRLIKFYANYWSVFIIFVPISVFCFNRPLSIPYGEASVFKCLLLDIVGFMGLKSYNITWWFNKLLLLLYLLFPSLFYACRRFPLLTLAISLIACIYWNVVKLDYFPYILLYLLPFVVGVFWSQGYLNRMIKQFEKVNLPIWIKALVALLFVLCLSGLRMYSDVPGLSLVRIDGFIAISIAVFIFTIKPYVPEWISFHVAYLGRHSANIYFLHTFINEYWPTSRIIHIFSDGLFRIVILLILCVVISQLMEWLKERLGLYSAVNWAVARLQ